MPDFWFFKKFVEHRYYGNGRRWTIGAENIKKQPNVKGPTQERLAYFASDICQKMKENNQNRSSSYVILQIPDVRADDGIWLRATLNGPWGFYVRGRYIAHRYCYKGKSVCRVTFRNKYVWADKGDLNLKHWHDRLLKHAEIVRFLNVWTALSIHPTDFPIDIRWTSMSTWTTKGIREPKETYGWPFE